MGGTSADVSIVDGDPSYPQRRASVSSRSSCRPSTSRRSERAAARSRGWMRAASSRWGRSRRGPIRGRSAMARRCPADRHGRLRHARRTAPGPFPAAVRLDVDQAQAALDGLGRDSGWTGQAAGGPRGGHREHVRAAHAPPRQARRGPSRVRLPPHGGAGPTHVSCWRARSASRASSSRCCRARSARSGAWWPICAPTSSAP